MLSSVSSKLQCCAAIHDFCTKNLVKAIKFNQESLSIQQVQKQMHCIFDLNRKWMPKYFISCLHFSVAAIVGHFSLSPNATRIVVHAFVCSRIDYCRTIHSGAQSGSPQPICGSFVALSQVWIPQKSLHCISTWTSLCSLFHDTTAFLCSGWAIHLE